MDNMGCLNTKSQNDLITNYIAQYPHMIDSGKRNDLSVNRTEHDLTDSNYKSMKEVSGQTETKVIHKPGNEQYYLQLSNSYSAMAQITK